MLDNPDKEPISKRVLVKVQSSVYPTGNLAISDEFNAIRIEMYGDENALEILSIYTHFPDLMVRGTKIYVWATVYPEIKQIDLDEEALPKPEWPKW